MRYLVAARVKADRESALLQAIESGTLGAGSVAGDEYSRTMRAARLCDDGTVRWVEVCYCAKPLDEERPYWEAHFDFVRIQDAHSRQRCADCTGTEPWACGDCNCTEALERKMESWGVPFLQNLKRLR